jgi:hypothetical protein
MNTQPKTPEQRAEEYGQQAPIYTCEFDVNTSHEMLIEERREAFLAGRADYEKELSERAGEGFEDFWKRSPLHETCFSFKSEIQFGFNGGRTPLLAKIALQEKRIAELERYINDKASNGYACECMTDCSCYETRITTLEAQNKKLGDVVLEMASLLEETHDMEAMGWADPIKQLKQERES